MVALKDNCTHFVGVQDKQDVKVHPRSWLMSCCSACWSIWFIIFLKHLVSLANVNNLLRMFKWKMSLIYIYIYIRNSGGPRMWTPDITGNSYDEWLLMDTVGVKIKFTFLKPYYDCSMGFIQCYYNTGVAVLCRSMLRSTVRCYTFNYVRTKLRIMQVRIATYVVAKHIRVANVKNRHLQNDLLTAVICSIRIWL